MLTDPNGPNPGKAIARKQRDEKVRKLKDLFRQARVYEDGRKARRVNCRRRCRCPL